MNLRKKAALEKGQRPAPRRTRRSPARCSPGRGAGIQRYRGCRPRAAGWWRCLFGAYRANGGATGLRQYRYEWTQTELSRGRSSRCSFGSDGRFSVRYYTSNPVNVRTTLCPLWRSIWTINCVLSTQVCAFWIAVYTMISPVKMVKSSRSDPIWE